MESHHYHAMELPTEETVRADFNNSTFENYGVTTRFFREDEKYLVETENQNGEMEVFEVAYTFGWEPLQQYLQNFPMVECRSFRHAGMWRRKMVSFISG